MKVVLCQPNSKKPLDWTTYEEGDAAVIDHKGNLACHLGESQLAVIDLDDPELEPLFERKFIPTTRKVKTPSGGFHYWFKISEPIQGIKTKGAELRTGNNLAMLPGSVVNGVEYKVTYHVNPDQLTPAKAEEMRSWIQEQNQLRSTAERNPVAVQMLDSQNLEKKMQIVKLFVPLWEEGIRQEASQALAGQLRHSGFTEADTTNIITLICRNAKDPETSQRIGAIKSTYAKPNTDRLTRGGKLKELFGEELIEKLNIILDIPQQYTNKLPDIWEWAETKKGEWKIVDIDILKAKNWLMQDAPFITLGDKVYTTLVYDNGYYRPGGEKVIQEKLQKITKGNFLKINNVREIIAHIQRDTFINYNKILETSKDLVCVKNGILNTITKELTPHTPNILFTQQIPASYNPEADCPKFKQFLKEIASTEEIIVLQEMQGHLLQRDYKYKKAFILVGPPNSGKTTLLKLIVAFIGKDNTSSLSLHAIVKDKFAAIHLKDKLLNFYDDLSSEDINDSGALKIVTGNGYVSGEHKFGERVHFENYAKLVFACNEIFGLKNKDMDDEAYYGRWIIFFFNNSFDGSKQNKGLFDTINTPEEMSGILNWALEGLGRLREQGSFSYNKSPDEIKSIMQRGSNTVAAFAQDCLVEAQGQWMSKEALYNAYCGYVKQEGLGRATKEKLGRDLPKFANYIIDSKSEKVTGWRNVKLKQGIHTFSKLISNIENDDNTPIFPHARNEKISMNSMIPQETDPTYFNCSLCDAPPPCKYANPKTGRPLCELCANPVNESTLED